MELPLPSENRPQALKVSDLLHSLPAAELEAFLHLAASACGVSTAGICLAGEDHIWQKTKGQDGIQRLLITRPPCSLALESLPEISDLSSGPCFPTYFPETSQLLRFFATVPLIGPNDQKLGALYAGDPQPGHLSADQRESLRLMASFIMDQIGLRKARLEAEDEKNQYRQLIEEAGDIIYTCTVEGLFTFINPRIKKLIGHEAESILGKHFTCLIVEEWREKAAGFYGEQFRRQTPVTIFEFPINTGDGSLKWVEQTVTLNMKDGVPHSFQGIVRDIHARKTAEEQLARVRRSKDDFLADMSHEIRTPLNAVLGFAELMSETALNAEQAEYVSAIATSGKNLLNLCNDILDYSKIEAGMMRFETVPLGLKSLFDSLAVLFREKAREKKIEVGFSVTDDMPATIYGDPTRLTQIIINLVSNALKFTPSGFVKIHAECAGGTDDRLDVRLTVRDSGIGISKDKLQHIFGRFSQAAGDTTRKYGGSGLGLNIVKSLVELQGGTVSVKSRIGHGSEFTIILPFRRSPLAEMISSVEEPVIVKENKALHILIMEDNNLNQALISKVISGFGFTADIASTGKEGIDLLRKNHYDLILMDMQMPVLNGYETTKVIRKDMKLGLPIIAMTAHILPDELERCLKIGMNDHIGKPFRKEELYNKIVRLTSAQEAVALPEAEVRTAEEANLINLSQVEAMADGDPDFVTQVLDLFIKDVPKNMFSIEEGLRLRDYPLIRTGAHTLKSTMNLFGLKDLLGDLLIRMENLAREHKPLAEIEPLYSILKNAGGRVVKEAEQLRLGF